MEELKDTHQIAEELGMPYQRIRKRLERALIEPVRIIGKTKLYPLSVVDQVRTVDAMLETRKENLAKS